MTDDPHTPTTAGPEPTPVVTAAQATYDQPAGTSAAGGSSPLANLPVDVDEHPEILVGAAFAGGILAAMVLKRLGR